MRKALSLLLVLSSLSSLAFDIPTSLHGEYKAEVPGFEFECQDKIYKASSYNVSLYLKSNSLRYMCGEIEFFGTYTNVIQGDNLLQLSVNVSNDASVAFDLGLKIFKKNQTILLTGLKGVPEVLLQRS